MFLRNENFNIITKLLFLTHLSSGNIEQKMKTSASLLCYTFFSLIRFCPLPVFVRLHSAINYEKLIRFWPVNK